MFNVTRLIHLVPSSDPQPLLNRLRASAHGSTATSILIEPTLPGVRNGGDVLMHLRFRSPEGWAEVTPLFQAQFEDAAVDHVDGADYRGATTEAVTNDAGTVYRTLLLRVAPGTDEVTIGRFEEDLSLMPRYVRTIAAWQLSRVDNAIGTSPWTHVFEQQFTDVDGLMGPYLMHPIHWAYVDRWFDPECPDMIVRDRVCHSFCRCDASLFA